jgi:hypothetical protein
MSARYPRAVKPNYALDVANTHYAYLGTPKLADVDWLVVSTNMKVATAYTLAHTSSGDSPALARNVTVKRTVAGNADTPGTVLVTGTDLEGAVVTETLTPGADGVVVAGAKAFATVTSIAGSSWVINQANDTIEFGFGALAGLPRAIANSINAGAVVAHGLVAGVIVAVPTIASSTTVLASNTVDLSSGTFDGSKDAFLVVVTP